MVHARRTVRHGIATMPFSRKTEISEAELEAVLAYLVGNANLSR